MSDDRSSRVRNLGYATLASQAGCASIVIIFAALFVGLWLDNRFGQRGPFTICFLILSIPLSLMVMLRVALAMIEEINPTQTIHTAKAEPEENEEDDH